MTTAIMAALIVTSTPVPSIKVHEGNWIDALVKASRGNTVIMSSKKMRACVCSIVNPNSKAICCISLNPYLVRITTGQVIGPTVGACVGRVLHRDYDYSIICHGGK